MIKHIATEIKNIFNFHDYSIPKTRLIELSKIIFSMNEEITKDKISSFFYKVIRGQYGVLYKMPTCLTSMYHKHLLENKNPWLK